MIELVTAAERLAGPKRKVSIAIAGRAKVGKTSLLLTLPEAETIALDSEAGLNAIEGLWHGDSIPLRSWTDTVNIACLLGGPDPSKAPDETFSQAHYDHVVGIAGGIKVERYHTIFVDSLTDLTRLTMGWAKTQPGAFSPRTGRPDLRGAYGLLGREVIGLLKHLQHAPGKNVIFVGGLDCYVNESGREVFELQTEGTKPAPSSPTLSTRSLQCPISTMTPPLASGLTISAKARTASFAANPPIPGGCLPATAVDALS